LLTSYPYPVQVWKLGDQSVMIMGGEVVVQYGIELKKRFGPDIFVIAYANDDMAYIPSETILKEGGYEGESSQIVYGMPARWNSDIEVKILKEFEKLAVTTGVKQVAK
jgi:neutral ceramidase